MEITIISQLESEKKLTIIYPESDGKLMAEKTKQFRWIIIIHRVIDNTESR